MTVTTRAIVETVQALQPAEYEDQCARVGVDPDALLDAATMWFHAAMRALDGLDSPERVAELLGANIVAGFTQGVIVGARLAQAGFATPEQVL